jgi:hypothetical protein
VRRTLFGFALVASLTVALLFLILPVVAIFTNTDPGSLLDSLGRESSREALWLSLRTTLAALAVIVVVGPRPPTCSRRASSGARRSSPRRSSCRSCCRPRSPGSACWRRSGRRDLRLGPGGGGIELVLQTARRRRRSDLRRRPLLPAPGAGRVRRVDPSLLGRARTLGASEARPSRALRFPAPGRDQRRHRALLGPGAGEFGATLMFAGSFQGITQTAPLAIFASFSTDFPARWRCRRARRLLGALLLSVKLLARCRCWAAPRRTGRCCGPRSRAGCGVRARPRGRCRRRPLPCPGGTVGRGKSTVLRAIAGLHRPDAAASTSPAGCWLDTRGGIDLAPERRRCGYLFQDYALFPHLSAWRNVAFGLTACRGASAAPMRSRRSLASGGGPRRGDAGAASGGERQRVALARALAADPHCCCSMSRSPRSTRAPPPRRARAGRTLSASERPASSSPMTSPRRRCSPTRSR